MNVIANIDIHITYISSYLEEPESKNTETHVSYLWRFNLILSYLFLRSSVGFRFCICPNLVVVRHSLVQNQRQSIKECRLLTQSTLVFSCFDLHNTIDLQVAWLYLWRILYLLLLKQYYWILFWYRPYFVDSWHSTPGQEAAAVAKQKDKRKSSRDWSLLAKSALVFSTFDPFQ